MVEMRQLFGGAIEALIPLSFIDASQFRQVPDNQEVLVDTSPHGEKSIIIELLDKVSDSDPLQYHFNSIIHDNEASSSSIQFKSSINHGKGYIRGEMTVIKFNPINPTQTDSHNVILFLGLLQLENVQTDLILTLNMPQLTQEMTSDTFSDKDFLNLLNSINVKDYSLFGS